MQALFFSPLQNEHERGTVGALESYFQNHLRCRVVRLPALSSQTDVPSWFSNIKLQIETADILVMVSLSKTLRVLGSYSEEIADLITEKINAGVPSVVELYGTDIPKPNVSDKELNAALSKIFSALDVWPHNIRVSLPREINDHPNEYSISITADDGVMRPDYLDDSTFLHVNQPILLTYDKKTYPLVEAPNGARFVDDGDRITSSIPGLRPCMIAYRTNKKTFQFISAAGMLIDGYDALGGFHVNGAEENSDFIRSILDEVADKTNTFESRARKAYGAFVECERGVGKLLRKVSGNNVESILVTHVREKLEEVYEGNLGRLTLLEMLLTICSKKRWGIFEPGMSNSDGSQLSRKEFSKLVDELNSGARNTLAHPAKSVLGSSDITEVEIEKLQRMRDIIWRARQKFMCD
ncbi:hypothetical protein [Leisingera sp. JC11]|uniref:hypothetical protein n=1 Tax=Leisingera sp. JC11 TaxID=3042469 RepID=UPI0034555F07